MKDAISILFGSTVTERVLPDETKQTVSEKFAAGQAVAKTTRYTETIKVASDSEVHAAFIELMGFIRSDKRRFDPELSCISDPSGRIYKAYKSWSERE